MMNEKVPPMTPSLRTQTAMESQKIPAAHWSNQDPVLWPLQAATRIVLAHDYGVSNDHSTLLLAGVFNIAGQQVIGVTYAMQMPLNEAPSTIVATVIEIANNVRPGALVLDTRGQRAHAEIIANNVSCPVVGVSATGQELHSTLPNHIPINVRGKPSALPVFSLSRTALFEDLQPQMERHTLRITTTGHGELCITELHDMVVMVNDQTGHRRWTTKEGQHDDMAVSLGMARWALMDWDERLHLRTRPKMRVDSRSALFSSEAWT